MELVAGGIENSQPGMGQASLQFFTARDRDHLVLAAVQDQYGLPDVAQAIANVVMPDGLVLANDRVERHLAKALGVLGHPLGVVENEVSLVEIRVAPKGAVREPWGLGYRCAPPLATAMGRAQDEAADGIRLIECQLLQDHPAQRDAEPVRRGFTRGMQHRQGVRRHQRDAVWDIRLVRLSGAAIVEGDHLELPGQRRDVAPPCALDARGFSADQDQGRPSSIDDVMQARAIVGGRDHGGISMNIEMAGAPTSGSSAVPEPAWRALRSLDPEIEEQVMTLATCLAMAEQRFHMLFEDVLPRFAQTPDDLSGKADVLADAHHSLTLLQESLHVTSRRMLDVLDRVSRELGE